MLVLSDGGKIARELLDKGFLRRKFANGAEIAHESDFYRLTV